MQIFYLINYTFMFQIFSCKNYITSQKWGLWWIIYKAIKICLYHPSDYVETKTTTSFQNSDKVTCSNKTTFKMRNIFTKLRSVPVLRVPGNKKKENTTEVYEKFNEKKYQYSVSSEKRRIQQRCKYRWQILIRFIESRPSKQK